MTRTELEQNAKKLNYKLASEYKCEVTGVTHISFTLGRGGYQWFNVYDNNMAVWTYSYSQRNGKTTKTRNETAWRLCIPNY